MTEATKDEAAEAKTEAPAEKKAPARKPAAKVRVTAAKPKKKVTDLTAEDLVDQKDGSPRPLSAITDNLQASVKGDMGRVLLSLSQRDYIGAEPVVLLAEHADELREIADQLDKLAADRLAE